MGSVGRRRMIFFRSARLWKAYSRYFSYPLIWLEEEHDTSLPLYDPHPVQKRRKMLVTLATFSYIIPYLWLSSVNNVNMVSLCMQEAILPCFCRVKNCVSSTPQCLYTGRVYCHTTYSTKSLYKWEQNEHFRCVTNSTNTKSIIVQK